MVILDTELDIFRDYQQSHPWITFNVDLKKADPQLWMLLGEAASKCEHLAGLPLKIQTAQLLHQIYMAKGVLGTTAIEGNTLTESQALEAVNGHLKVEPSQQYLADELQNIINAANSICADVASGADLTLTPARLHSYNEFVLTGLPPEPDVIPGKTREHDVTVGSVYRGAPWKDLDILIGRLCGWLAGRDFQAPPGQELHFSILKAILAHLYIAWIHPYGNGNGRTARLVEFHLLVASGVPTPAAHLLSNHYNQTRSEYYRQLDLASRSGGDPIPFIGYALQGLVDGLKGQIEIVREQQLELTWHEYVEDLFGHQQTPSNVRRKKLLTDLSQANRVVPKNELRELSTQLGIMYSGLTGKALTRDLNSPIVNALVERTSAGYRARRELILAFLPLRRIP